MIQRIIVCMSVFFTLFAIGMSIKGILNHKTNLIENMPLVHDHDDPYAYLAKGYLPIEQRGDEYKKWLSAGVKINVSGASGSGTIIYYSEVDGYAYIQSCGHLWDGNMTAEEGKVRMTTCRITTWYHNDNKLTSPKNYPADVIYYSNSQGRDCSLLRFKPDWIPEYFPIAPEDFEFPENTRFHSIGCDSGGEIAHYDVRYVGMRGNTWPDLITTENSPRPGRSGGGLLSDSFYVGICWGTSAFDGGGNGFFTPLKTIREYNKMNGFGWLNEVGYSLARHIPIVDRNNPQNKYPKDYIPLPNN